MKIKLNENEVLDILRKHKLVSESIEISDIITSSTPKDTKNFKSFVEFLNGNVKLDDIVSDIKSFISGTIDSEKTDIEVGSTNSSDVDIYKDILKQIDADNTEENMKVFYAWRQAEGAKAAYNPFNTTHKMDGSTLYNCLKKKNDKCVGGVRNYDSEEDGITATAKTIKNGYYPCILNGLRNNIGAKNIATKCLSDLKTWGTGDLVRKVLTGPKLNPPAISKSSVKIV
jgi:hypothetical protein